MHGLSLADFRPCSIGYSTFGAASRSISRIVRRAKWPAKLQTGCCPGVTATQCGDLPLSGFAYGAFGTRLHAFHGAKPLPPKSCSNNDHCFSI
jgi:hypothetical protein